MKKKICLILIYLLSILNVYAFEDCLITTNGKLTDISIEQNDIIDVFPIFTIMNEKNSIIVHPLQEGKTRFCLLKDKKKIVMFNVEVKVDETIIDEVDGFDILKIDEPPEVYEYELDAPPLTLNTK